MSIEETLLSQRKTLLGLTYRNCLLMKSAGLAGHDEFGECGDRSSRPGMELFTACKEPAVAPLTDPFSLVTRMLGFAATNRQLRAIIEAQIAHLLSGILLREEQGLLRAKC